MYLLSAYFDEKTNKALGRLIERIALETGNTFMTDNHVLPHLTVSSVETRQEAVLLNAVERIGGHFQKGRIDIVSPGMFLPYVLYVMPVLNDYLQDLAQNAYTTFRQEPEVKINSLYQPMHWLPHITLGKKLGKEQMQKAFYIVQEQFQPLSAEVAEIGLARPNPHREIWKCRR